MGAQEQEPATAEVAGGGMDDGEGKAGGDGGVDCVAAGAEGFKAGVGGEVVDADDHSVTGADGLLVEVGNHVLGGLLGCGGDGDGERGAGEGGQDGEKGPSGHGVLTG